MTKLIFNNCLIIIFCAFPFVVSSQIINETFEKYEKGLFDTQWDSNEWSTLGNNFSHTVITNEKSFSGNYSLKISEGDEIGNILGILPEMNSGIWTVTFMQYLPSGFGGSLNFHHDYTSDPSNAAFALVYGDTSAFYFTTNAKRNYDIALIHNTWIENKLEFNFLTGMANYYYDGDLKFRWPIASAVSGLNGFDQINGFNLYGACTQRNCKGDAYYDDFLITHRDPLQYDVGLEFPDNSSPYTKVPITEITPLNFGVQVLNQGLRTAHNIEVVAKVEDENNNVLYSEALIFLDSLMSNEVVYVNSSDNSFKHTDVGTYYISYSIVTSNPDGNLLNNKLRVSDPFIVTEDLYARSNGKHPFGLGILNGSIFLSQNYNFSKDQIIKSLSLSLWSCDVGDFVRGHIYSTLANGMPDLLLYSTTNKMINIEGNASGFNLDIELDFINPSILTSGKYAFVIETDAAINASQKKYTPNSTWVSFDGTQWETLNSSGAALDIKPRLESFITTTDEAESIQELMIYPNPSSGIITVNFKNYNSSNVQISVSNLQGQKRYSQKQKDAFGLVSYNLDLGDFADGIYLLEIQLGDHVEYRKVHITND